VSERRGYLSDPGGGLTSRPRLPSRSRCGEVLQSRLWRPISEGHIYDYQSSMFQPVGGMEHDRPGIRRELGNLIRYNAKVTGIKQDEAWRHGFLSGRRSGGPIQLEQAQWCVCTIPGLDPEPDPDECRGPDEKCDRCALLRGGDQVGLQFNAPLLGAGRVHLRRHFLYGFAQRADRLPEQPLFRMTDPAYCSAPTRLARIASPVYGDAAGGAHQSHRRVRQPDSCAIPGGIPARRAVAWHRVPWAWAIPRNGSDELRAQHFDNLLLRSMDASRWAGDYASSMGGWQEGRCYPRWMRHRRLHARRVGRLER